MIIYGFRKHGFRFLKLFVPSGVPIYILPLVTSIEVLSFLSRPLSHSVRLFANILAGHITLYVFGAFVTMLGTVGILGWLGAVIPLGMTVALMALELLIVPPSLRFRNSHLHLSQRCDPRWTLTP